MGNKPERSEWFQNLGMGMFIHWSMDSQLGVVISHSMAGASDDYLDRFVNELPASFLPKKFDPDDWARLAKLAGMKYVGRQRHVKLREWMRPFTAIFGTKIKKVHNKASEKFRKKNKR